MTTTLNAYDSLAEFMASLDPVKVISFHAPSDLQMRVEVLLEKQQESSLPTAEKEELDHYLILEHIVRLAKSRARLHLAENKVRAKKSLNRYVEKLRHVQNIAVSIAVD